MFNKILGTTASKILNAVYNLIILLLITNYIGSEGFGTIGLVLVAITMIQIFIDLLGGGAIIYFSSRFNQTAILIISYVWIVMVVALLTLLSLLLYKIFPDFFNANIPPGQENNIIILALFNSIMLSHYNMLIGQGKIKQYNIVFIIQISILVVSFLYHLFFIGDYSPMAYIQSLKVSYITGALISFIVLSRYLKFKNVGNLFNIVQQMFKFGFISQLANGFHILNKRISFYFINAFTGLAAVGVYNSGVQLTEGLRLIGQSISLVQFSEISNSKDSNFAKNISIKLMKLALLLTFFGLLVLILIPQGAYEYLFTKEFDGLKSIIIALSPGVMALAANTIFSHYFSGLGNPKISLWGNIIGFVVTIVFAIILIPILGYVGAALTASLSYSSTVIYQYFVFKKQTQTKLSDWYIRKTDITDMLYLLKNRKK